MIIWPFSLYFSPGNTYCCDYISCKKIYKSWFQLQRHRSLHFNKIQSNLGHVWINITLLIFNLDKPYFCDWSGCKYQFKKLKNLIIHRRIHTGNWFASCSIKLKLILYYDLGRWTAFQMRLQELRQRVSRRPLPVLSPADP